MPTGQYQVVLRIVLSFRGGELGKSFARASGRKSLVLFTGWEVTFPLQRKVAWIVIITVVAVRPLAPIRYFGEQNMSHRSTIRISVVAFLALFTPMARADDPRAPAEPAQAKPEYVSKGEGYVICVLPHSDSVSLRAKAPKPARLERWPWYCGSPGASVLHISLGDGTVKCLLASGETSHPGPIQNVMWTYYEQSRIHGVCADRRRLYVLASVAGKIVPDLSGRGTARPTGQNGHGQPTGYLFVFDVREGTLRFVTELKDVEIPTPHPFATPQMLGIIPIKLLDDGVAVYGKAFRLDGEKLVPR